ncbi:MAG TPA: PAS domain S-box protein [Spirochaetota bacterium]|nr:PAS domain S-box protein [Spirochaetota bacterium]HPL15380.1 PAS domain S-box protein [Spirochaetota bacterium]HQF08289.1 PAS domain S-box protein [Spirochaetota bacterium]HQH97096.1 PAS domain S-box protein [Spirochaetota bacterium]HQJ70006.1 PAS domain S-box protein [Spirochaetota bacterium]
MATAACLLVLILVAGIALPAAGAGAASAGPALERAITLDEPVKAMNIGALVDYLEDRDSRLSIGSVSSPGLAPHFRKSTTEFPNFGLTSSAYWMRFTFLNPKDRAISFDLVISYPLLDDIMLYVPEGSGGFRVKKTGDRYPFKERELKHTNFIFPLVMGPGRTTCYLRVKTVSAMSIPLSIMSRAELYRLTMADNWVNGLFYGMLIIMLVYNLFLFLSIRGKDYLFYSLYIAAFLMASVAIRGHGAQYLWPGAPLLSDTSLYNYLFLSCYILFIREFMSTRLLSPLLDRACLAVAAMGAAGIALTLVFINSMTVMVLSIVMAFLTVFLTLLVSVVGLYRKTRQANFFLASWAIIITGILVYAFRALGIIPMNIVTMSYFRFAMLGQIMIFSFGLSDRINTMKKKLEILNANIVREMSEHIRDKEALRRSEERFRGVIERNFDIIFMMDAEGRITYMSPSITALSGYRVDEVVGNNFKNYVSEDMMGLGMLVFGDLLKGKEIIGYETSFRKKDGTRFSVEINLSPIMKDGVVTGVQGIARDISERKMAEEALLEEKERLAITLRSIGEGVIATDIKWRVHLMNKAAEDLTGWRQDEVRGKNVSDVMVLRDQKTGVPRDLAKGGAASYGTDGFRSNTVLVRRDGSERTVSERVAPIFDRAAKTIGYVIVARDITDEVKFHNELLKVEKLESIGILAGGIAHDFNNILTAIIGNINLAKLTAQENPRLLDILDDAEKASHRAQELTHQFLTFSKGGAPVRQIASIEDIIRDSARFILRGSNVRCVYNFQDGLWPVNVDVGQFSQVIQNLVINADQAMPEGGDLTIITENVVMAADSGLPVRPGRYVRITIADTGIGIPLENQSKIFDPYFTTKGSGNGLGLTSSYSIVKRHDGYIFVDSQPGTGTSFFIYLPSSDAAAVAEKDDARSSPTGSGSILFMDDDQAVNTTATKMLRHLGYTVDIALDGDMAVTMFEHSLRDGPRYDLVILDLTIPGGMGGKKTIEKLLALDSGVRAIVSSGYSNDPIMANFRDYGFSGVIAKPYRIDELARVVQQILQEKKAG